MDEKWLPIETAPKDGTKILVWTGMGHSVAVWEVQKYHRKPIPYWRTQNLGMRVTMDRAYQPTHWMPLPDPPDGPITTEGEDD